MCGITGIFGLEGLTDPRQVVAAMNRALAHRGPDASGVWADDHVAFGHQRLSIIDLGHASDQPFLSLDGRYTLVFNGEIYNYRELRAQLEPTGWVFRTASDTEVLLAAFATWGEACLHRLFGMFAFALWDAKKEELFLARNRMGSAIPDRGNRAQLTRNLGLAKARHRKCADSILRCLSSLCCPT